jgi:aconitate hydratase
MLSFKDAPAQIMASTGGKKLIIHNQTTGKDIEVAIALSERQVKIILAGGLLNYTKNNN